MIRRMDDYSNSIAEMKMIKKAKIVNISLGSNQQQPPNIHMALSNSQQLFQNAGDRQQSLMNNCYEAIKIIQSQKLKAAGQDKTMQAHSSTKLVKALSRGDKQSEVKMALPVAESIEVILKRFIKIRADEESSHYASNTTKHAFMPKKKPPSNAILFRKHKENINADEPGRKKTTEEDECLTLFRSTSPNYSNERLKNKIQEFERQKQYFENKVAEQASIIAKLEAKTILIKKQYHDEMVKVIRSKNIFNIHSNFEREFEGKSEGKYLNVDGRTFLTSAKDKKYMDPSPRSTESIDTSKEMSRSKKKKHPKKKNSIEPFKRYEANNNPTQNYEKNYKKKQEQLEMIIPELPKETIFVPPEVVISTISSEPEPKLDKVGDLKKNLQDLQKERQKVVDELNGISQIYEVKIDVIDKNIMQNIRQIRQEEELLTDEELKMLKDEDFETFEMNGFYDSSVAQAGQNQD